MSSLFTTIAMHTLRHFIFPIIIIVVLMVSSACSASQSGDSGSITLVPDRLPSNEPGVQPAARTPSAARTEKIEDGTLLIPGVTHSPMPILDMANSWTRYRGNYGISFEYPSIYDEKPYNEICKATESLDGADFGEKSEVYVRQPLGATLDEHVKLYLENLQFDEPVKIESQEAIEINHQPAIIVKYKLGEAIESWELIFVFIPERKVIYTFSFVGGSACDVPEIGLSEQTVFGHAVETFYVEK